MPLFSERHPGNTLPKADCFPHPSHPSSLGEVYCLLSMGHCVAFCIWFYRYKTRSKSDGDFFVLPSLCALQLSPAGLWKALVGVYQTGGGHLISPPDCASGLTQSFNC